MELTKLLDREHIFLDTRVQSDKDAIHRLGEVLKQSGYINDTYIDAVLSRDANEHIDMLQKLFTMFQQEEQVEKLLTASTADDFQHAFLSALQ